MTVVDLKKKTVISAIVSLVLKSLSSRTCVEYVLTHSCDPVIISSLSAQGSSAIFTVMHILPPAQLWPLDPTTAVLN